VSKVLNQATLNIEKEIFYFKNKILQFPTKQEENQSSLDQLRRNLNHLLILTINSELNQTDYENTMQFLKSHYKYLQSHLAIK